MKAKYLGLFYMTNVYANIDEEDEVLEYRFTNIDDEEDYYNSDLFMRVKDSMFSGIMNETNTSAIACKIIGDDEVKLWRIY